MELMIDILIHNKWSQLNTVTNATGMVKSMAINCSLDLEIANKEF